MEREKVIAGLLRYGRPAILEHYRVDSCLASARVAVEVLHPFAIPAQPLVVSTIAFNKAAYAHVEKGDLEGGKRSMEEFYSIDGSWSVGIGLPDNLPGVPPTEPSKWNG